MKFLLQIAYRFLKSNKAQTIIITVGIAIGIGVQIFLGLLIQNLQKDLINNTVGGSSHITIKEKDNNLINNIDELEQKVISSSDGVKWASKTLDMPALLGDENKNTSVLVRGSDLQNSNEIYKFEKSLVEGNMPTELPEFTALENVLMPYLISGDKVNKETRDRVIYLMKRMGLEKVMNNKGNAMSGGQQQRTAIARALMNNPKILLADEPTGNLDSDTAEEIYKLFAEINKEDKTTIVVITHDDRIASKADRIIEIKDGMIKSI